MNILITDIMFPNKYSRWRNEEIKSFILDKSADILVLKRINQYASVDFTVDFNFINELVVNLSGYNILIFDKKFNYLNQFNTKIDGTCFNDKYFGSYLLTKRNLFRIQDYDLVYHIFLMNYISFNRFYTFPQERQAIHLDPGGGYDTCSLLNPIDRRVKVISTHPFTTLWLKAFKHENYIEALGGCFLQKDYTPNYKELNRKIITVCFSSLGFGEQKGDFYYLDIVNSYIKYFPDDSINFFSVGNCREHHKVTHFPPMDYLSLSEFYSQHVDIYLNVEIGKAFNGWPLGVESLLEGSVLLTTDPYQVSNCYQLPRDTLFVCDSAECFLQKIKHFHDDRHYLNQSSKNSQRFFTSFFKWENQQGKIFSYLEQ